MLAAIAITSVLTGIGLYVLGRFKLGNLIRFIPYPVVGGFLAGVLLTGLGTSTTVLVYGCALAALAAAASASRVLR